MTSRDELRELSEGMGDARERRLERYAEYRSSGIEWLGEVPSHWNVKPLKHLCNFVNGFPFKPTDWLDQGIPIIRIENLNGGESFNYFGGDVPARYYVRPGDLLFGWSGNRGTSFGPFIWSRAGLHYLNQHIFHLTNYHCDKMWLYWVLKGMTHYIETEAHGIIGMVHITLGKLGRIGIPFVAIDEQRTIAAFLDRETARIDALIAKKRQLIDLLHEERTALISRAVTKGLDPSAPMKPCGIDSLGDVPTGWAVKRLRFSMKSIEQEWSPQCENRLADEGEWAVLKVGCVNGHAFDETEQKALPADLTPLAEYEIKPGDILMSRANTRELLGSAAFVEGVRPRLMLCDKLYRIRVDESEIDGRFLVFTFRSAVCRFQFERDAEGASGSMKNIGQDSVKNLWLPLPLLHEQEKIVAFIRTETGNIDGLISSIVAAIDRVQEYRAALISAAVTGKIDVRGHEAASGLRS